MSEQQRPMPPMSGNQRQDYQRQILEGGQSPNPSIPTLSPEEQALLRKCSQEAFWKRAAPLGILCMGSVGFASHKGLITNGVKLKTFAAGFVGYSVGKFSYSTEMQDRFLAELPNSEVSKMIRKARRLPEPEDGENIPDVHGNDLSYFQSKPDVPIVDSDPRVNNEHKDVKFGISSYDQLREQHQKRYPVQKPSMEPGFYIPEHHLAESDKIPGQQSPIWQQPVINKQEAELPPPQTGPPLSSGYSYDHKTNERPRRQSTNKYGDEGFE